MIQALDGRPREFIARLKALSDALASGPEDQGFEARVLKRLSVWQRRRGGIPVVAGRAGLGSPSCASAISEDRFRKRGLSLKSLGMTSPMAYMFPWGQGS
jgi:hypothetical protein